MEVNALFETELEFALRELSGRGLRELSPSELSRDIHQCRALESVAEDKHYSGVLGLCSREGQHVWLRSLASLSEAKADL